MDQNNKESSADAKSFKLYTTKAPILLQLLAGLIWLGSAGLVMLGLGMMLINPIIAVIFLVFAVFLFIGAKSMYKMKKSAFIYSIMIAVIIVIFNIISKGTITISSLLIPAIILISAFGYKSIYVND